VAFGSINLVIQSHIHCKEMFGMFSEFPGFFAHLSSIISFFSFYAEIFALYKYILGRFDPSRL
jgi:hypothetical protein